MTVSCADCHKLNGMRDAADTDRNALPVAVYHLSVYKVQDLWSEAKQCYVGISSKASCSLRCSYDCSSSSPRDALGQHKGLQEAQVVIRTNSLETNSQIR